MKPPLPVVACVPVEYAQQYMPDFLARSTYSTYVEALCPRCDARMWLGARGKAACEAGLATMLCMACALREHGPVPIHKLTDLDR